MRHASLLVTTLLLASACGARASQQQDFMMAVRGYSDGLRWQRHTHAAAYIPRAEREAFLDEREDLADDLRVDDYEITRVRVGKRGNRARVRVKYTWHLDSRGLVHTTVVQQSWERHGKRWLVAEEHRLRGEEMPGVSEAPESREPSEIEAARAGPKPGLRP